MSKDTTHLYRQLSFSEFALISSIHTTWLDSVYHIEKNVEQAVAELGHTRIPSCQLGQFSDQVEPDRLGMVLVSKRSFLKVYFQCL